MKNLWYSRRNMFAKAAATLGAAFLAKKVEASPTLVKSSQLFVPQLEGTAWDVYLTGGKKQLVFTAPSLKTETLQNPSRIELGVDWTKNPVSYVPGGFKKIKVLTYDLVSKSWEVGEPIPSIHQLFVGGLLMENGVNADYTTLGTKIIPIAEGVKDAEAKVIIYI